MLSVASGSRAANDQGKLKREIERWRLWKATRGEPTPGESLAYRLTPFSVAAEPFYPLATRVKVGWDSVGVTALAAKSACIFSPPAVRTIRPPGEANRKSYVLWLSEKPGQRCVTRARLRR